jgi:hypothetical protein
LDTQQALIVVVAAYRDNSINSMAPDGQTNLTDLSIIRSIVLAVLETIIVLLSTFLLHITDHKQRGVSNTTNNICGKDATG